MGVYNKKICIGKSHSHLLAPVHLTHIMKTESRRRNKWFARANCVRTWISASRAITAARRSRIYVKSQHSRLNFPHAHITACKYKRSRRNRPNRFVCAVCCNERHPCSLLAAVNKTSAPICPRCQEQLTSSSSDIFRSIEHIVALHRIGVFQLNACSCSCMLVQCIFIYIQADLDSVPSSLRLISNFRYRNSTT